LAESSTRAGSLWRSRELLIAILAGLLVTAFVVVRDARRDDATFTVGAAPRTPMTAIEITGSARRSFALPRLPAQSRGFVQIHIATYLQRPSATVTFAILNARRHVEARCVFPPTAYVDNSQLECDVPSLARARTLVVTHKGPAKLAVFGNQGVVGTLVFRNSHSLFGRMRTVTDRVGIALPAGVGPAVLIGGLWLSVAAAVLAVLLAFGIAREGADPLLEQGEPLRKPAGVLAEPRDHEREVQHDGEEESQRDDE
jgi:hypothetical protein